ncbi:ABC transporter substrate-binding protein [Dactylosporangium sp. CA-139066]|uniref:ABC transporter substrate-binding protein n=1 Tax=Dactylosporangium sp. CA-139066 TaxID=3239930 RepID=UPI003D8BE476
MTQLTADLDRARSGEPVRGGTLRIAAPGPVTHLDPACAYDLASAQLLRAVTRQLFTYPSTVDLSDPGRAFGLVADVAEELPTRRNGGISADRRTWTVRLRRGVLWDSVPRRPVVAGDFVRALKRLANPVTGAGAIRYFTSTIGGMAQYCAEYRAAFRDRPPTARALADFQNAHEIAGVTALDDATLRIRLVEPADDLPHLLALSCASAVPREYDRFVPGSTELFGHLRSAGPYSLALYRDGGRLLRLERNPVWDPDEDQVRGQFVGAIEVSATGEPAGVVAGRLDRGEADLAWSMDEVSWTGEPAGGEEGPPTSAGYTLNPYLVFNLRSPNRGGLTGRAALRRAVALAVDKRALAGILAGGGVPCVVQHGVIPPGCVGHRPFNAFPTPGDRGDPGAARAELAAAGLAAERLTLVAAVRDIPEQRAVLDSIAADLGRAGIDLAVVPYPPGEYYDRLLGDPAQARAGAWDLALAGWVPDWFGDNGRAVVQPLFESNDAPGTTNYGGYHNPQVDRLVAAALRAGSRSRAEELWHRVDRLVTGDVAVVPLLACAMVSPRRHSPRLRNVRYLPHCGFFDVTSLWLDGATEPWEVSAFA